MFYPIKPKDNESNPLNEGYKVPVPQPQRIIKEEQKPSKSSNNDSSQK